MDDAIKEFIQRAELPVRRILADHGIPEEEGEDLLHQSLLAVFYRWKEFEDSDQALQKLLGLVKLQCERYERDRHLDAKLGKDERPQGS